MEGFYFRDIFLMVKVYLKDLFLETKKQKIVCYYLKKKKKEEFCRYSSQNDKYFLSPKSPSLYHSSLSG